MKKPLLLAGLICVSMLAAATAQAQVYSTNTVGYVNASFQPGYNWFGNPLYAPPNMLSALIPTAPDGTTVSLWSPTLNLFTPTVTFSGGAWSSDLTLNPGTGAALHTTSLFANTFIGTVLNFDGSIWGGGLFTQPPAFAGPNGVYLLSSKAPIALSGHVFNAALNQFSVFESVIGRAPHAGEWVETLNPLTQVIHRSTFDGSAWLGGDPSLAVGEAGRFNIGPIPEPSVLGLLGIGLAALGITRRRPGSQSPRA